MGLSGVSRRDALGRTTDLTLMPSLNVGLSGVEPLTSRLSGVRSNQLSYRPIGVNLKSHQRTTLKPLTFPLEKRDALTN